MPIFYNCGLFIYIKKKDNDAITLFSFRKMIRIGLVLEYSFIKLGLGFICSHIYTPFSLTIVHSYIHSLTNRHSN